MGPLRFERRSEDPQSPRITRLPYGPSTLMGADPICTFPYLRGPCAAGPGPAEGIGGRGYGKIRTVCIPGNLRSKIPDNGGKAAPGVASSRLCRSRLVSPETSGFSIASLKIGSFGPSPVAPRLMAGRSRSGSDEPSLIPPPPVPQVPSPPSPPGTPPSPTPPWTRGRR